MRPHACVLPFVALAAARLLGCGAPAQVRYEESLERTPPPAAHAVHGERLDELMRGLERLRSERLPQAMDVREAGNRRADQIATVARAMAASAARIAEAADQGSLDESQRREFAALAEELAQRSRRLADDAPRLEPDALRARLAGIEATCDACHRRFRIPRDGG